MCVVRLQFADLNNDSSLAEDRHPSKLPLNGSKYIDSIDINSNALVEPNREILTNVVDKDGGQSASPCSRRLMQTGPASMDSELSSVAHMLDAASPTNFCTLLAPSLTPPKTGADIGLVTEKAAVPDNTAPVEAIESVAKANAKDTERIKVHTFTEIFVSEIVLSFHILL